MAPWAAVINRKLGDEADDVAVLMVAGHGINGNVRWGQLEIRSYQVAREVCSRPVLTRRMIAGSRTRRERKLLFYEFLAEERSPSFWRSPLEVIKSFAFACPASFGGVAALRETNIYIQKESALYYAGAIACRT